MRVQATAPVNNCARGSMRIKMHAVPGVNFYFFTRILYICTQLFHMVNMAETE